MKIGNIPKDHMAVQLNKWIIGVEILKQAPYKCYGRFALRPYFLFICVKTTDYGTEFLEMNGRPAKRVGGWWSFEFPFGIQINII